MLNACDVASLLGQLDYADYCVESNDDGSVVIAIVPGIEKVNQIDISPLLGCPDIDLWAAWVGVSKKNFLKVDTTNYTSSSKFMTLNIIVRNFDKALSQILSNARPCKPVGLDVTE